MLLRINNSQASQTAKPVRIEGGYGATGVYFGDFTNLCDNDGELAVEVLRQLTK